MSMAKNTLFISFDGLSDPLGQSQILPYLCGIAKNGYQITVLSCEKKDRLLKEEKYIRQLIKEFSIDWQYIIYDEDGGFLSRYSYIKQLHGLAKKIHLQKQLSLIHCRSYLASLIGLKFKRKYNIPFVFDMRGFWADERIDGGIWKKDNLLHKAFYNYFKKKEKQFVFNADAIVSLTHAGAKVLCEKFGLDVVTKKTSIIPCCTNTDLFQRKAEHHGFLVPGISKKDHVLIYTGSVGTWYYTQEMIDCVLSWQKQIPHIKLLIVTKDKEALDVVLKKYTDQERQVIISDSASYSQMPAYLSIAKAAIFFIKPAFSKIASSPTKMAECWAMNLPIITNAGIGDNDLYFSQHHGGVLIDQFNKDSYANALNNYLDLQNQSVNYRGIALNYFDSKMAIEKYTGIYNSLIK